MMRRCIINLLLLLWVALIGFGCMGQSATTQPIYYYTLEYQAQLPEAVTQLPYVLRVHRFSVSPPFNSQRIIYADKGLHRNSYGYHQWIASPGELLPYLLVRDMRQSKSFQAVLTPDAVLPATHDLHGWVEQFIEQDTTQPRQALARLHITLTAALASDPSRKVLFQKRYEAHAPCKGKTAEALARAMSEAIAKINHEVVQDLHKQLMAK